MSGTEVKILAGNKIVLDLLNEVNNKKIDQAKELEPVEGGALPTPGTTPAGQDYKMQVSGGKAGRTFTHATLTGGSKALTSKEIGLFYWNGTTRVWSYRNGQELPSIDTTQIDDKIEPILNIIDFDYEKNIFPIVSHASINSNIITGYGQLKDALQNVYGVIIPIYPTSSEEKKPTSVTARIRFDSWDGPVVATKTISDSFEFETRKDVTFLFDAPILNPDNKKLFAEWVTNGLTAAYGTGVANTNGKWRYTNTNNGENMPFESGSSGLSITFLLNKVSKINSSEVNRIGEELGLTPLGAPVLLLTSKVWLYPNTQYNIFNKNVCVTDFGDNLSNYRLDFNGDTGQQFERGYRLNSIPQSLNKVIGLNLMRGRNVLASKNQNILSTTTANGAGNTRKVLIIADSLGNDGNINSPLKTTFDADVMNIAYVGTRGEEGLKNEARPGWRTEDYHGIGQTLYKISVSGIVVNPSFNARYTQGTGIYNVEEVNITGGIGYFSVRLISGTAPTASGVLTKTSGSGDTTITYSSIETTSGNPFYNPTVGVQKFDFAYYMSTTGQSMAANDWVFFQLGINDVFGISDLATATAKANTVVSQLNEMITSIHNYNSSIRVGVCVTIPSANQDGFATNYSLGQLSEMYQKTGLVTLQNKFIETYDTTEMTNSRVYVVPCHLNIDTDFNFPTTTRAVNSRNTATVIMQDNGVHPSGSGYAQIADMYAGVIKYFG